MTGRSSRVEFGITLNYWNGRKWIANLGGKKDSHNCWRDSRTVWQSVLKNSAYKGSSVGTICDPKDGKSPQTPEVGAIFRGMWTKPVISFHRYKVDCYRVRLWGKTQISDRDEYKICRTLVLWSLRSSISLSREGFRRQKQGRN